MKNKYHFLLCSIYFTSIFTFSRYMKLSESKPVLTFLCQKLASDSANWKSLHTDTIDVYSLHSIYDDCNITGNSWFYWNQINLKLKLKMFQEIIFPYTHFCICLSNQSLCFRLFLQDSGMASIPSLHPNIAPATQAFVSASPP